MTGDPSSLYVYNGNNGKPYTVESISLTDATTGLNQLPGFTLNVGDTISGTVTLSSPFTMPASAAFGLYYPADILIDLVGTGDASNIYFPETLTYYDNGVQVSPPSGLGPFGGSGGVLAFGESSSGVATSSFTFDEIVFSGTITEMLDDSYQDISSANLTAATPYLSTVTYSASAPEPATAWLALMLSVVGGLGILGRRRKRTV